MTSNCCGEIIVFDISEIKGSSGTLIKLSLEDAVEVLKTGNTRMINSRDGEVGIDDIKCLNTIPVSNLILASSLTDSNRVYIVYIRPDMEHMKFYVETMEMESYKYMEKLFNNSTIFTEYTFVQHKLLDEDCLLSILKLSYTAHDTSSWDNYSDVLDALVRDTHNDILPWVYKLYLDNNKISYSLASIAYGIHNAQPFKLDKSCKVVNLTGYNGVISDEGWLDTVSIVVFNSKPEKIDTFIVPLSVSITQLYPNQTFDNSYIEVDDFYLLYNSGDTSNAIDYRGLSGLHIHRLHISLDCLRVRLENIFNNCTIDSIDGDMLIGNYSLYNSFNNTEIKFRELCIATNKIVSSFNNFRGNILISEGLHGIRNSIKDIPADYTVNIEHISCGTIINSFINVGKLKDNGKFISDGKFDIASLKSCMEYQNVVYQSFCLCDDIKSINQLNLEKLDISSFIPKESGYILNIDEHINEVTFPAECVDDIYARNLSNQSDVEDIAANIIEDKQRISITVKLPNGLNSINDTYLKGFTGKQSVIFPKTVKILGHIRDLSGDIVDLNLPSTITSILAHAFWCTKVTSFDSGKFPKLHEINMGLFTGCEIKTVILRDNINELSDFITSIDDLSYADNIILSPGIKGVSNHNLGADKNILMNIYVINRDNEYSSLSSSTNTKIIEVGSIDEALGLIEKNKIDNKNTLNKLDMLIEGNDKYKKYRGLRRKPFSEYASFIFKMMHDISSTKEIPNVDAVVLDKSKFKYIESYKVACLHIDNHYSNYSYYPNINKVSESADKSIPITDVHENKFNSVCNLITKTMSLSSEWYTEQKLDELNNSRWVATEIICKSGKNVIVVIQTSYMVYDCNKLLLICMGDKICYMSTFKTNDANYVWLNHSSTHYEFTITHSLYNKCTRTLVKYLSSIDNISYDLIIGGKSIPKDMYWSVWYALWDTMFIIRIDVEQSRMYLFDSMTSLVVLVSMKDAQMDGMGLKYIRNMSVIRLMYLDDYIKQNTLLIYFYKV